MKRIMIAVDFSDQTEKVMQAGLEVAKKFEAEVVLLHTETPAVAVTNSNVVGPYGGMGGFGVDVSTADEIIQEQITKDEEILADLKEQAVSLGLDVKADVFIGSEISGIMDECEKHQPDLLVMGLHHKGFMSRFLGENPELALVKNAPCALMFIPE